MSQTTTHILLPQTTYSGTGPYAVTGDRYPAAAYYLSSKDLQTVNIKLTGATGNVIVEASLATTPLESDWFVVHTVVANNTSNVNSTGSLYQNIPGNFVYIRAKVEDFATGVVNHVKLTY